MQQLQDAESGDIGSNSRSTVVIRELKEKHNNDSGEESEENLPLVQFENRNNHDESDTENIGQPAPRRVKRIPRNYVQMREPA